MQDFKHPSVPVAPAPAPVARITTAMLERTIEETRHTLGLTSEVDFSSVAAQAALEQFTDMTVAEFCMLLRLLQIDTEHCCHNPARLETAAMTILTSRANPWRVLTLTFDKTWNCDGPVVPMVRARLSGSVPKEGYVHAIGTLRNLLLKASA